MGLEDRSSTPRLAPDLDGDLAMLETLRAGLARADGSAAADLAFNDQLRYALQLLGADA
jgi:hypothetical protein